MLILGDWNFQEHISYFQFCVAILISNWHFLFPFKALFLQVVPAFIFQPKQVYMNFSFSHAFYISFLFHTRWFHHQHHKFVALCSVKKNAYCLSNTATKIKKSSCVWWTVYDLFWMIHKHNGIYSIKLGPVACLMYIKIVFVQSITKWLPFLCSCRLQLRVALGLKFRLLYWHCHHLFLYSKFSPSCH